jgi:hypothetical protein
MQTCANKNNCSLERSLRCGAVRRGVGDVWCAAGRCVATRWLRSAARCAAVARAVASNADISFGPPRGPHCARLGVPRNVVLMCCCVFVCCGCVFTRICVCACVCICGCIAAARITHIVVCVCSHCVAHLLHSVGKTVSRTSNRKTENLQPRLAPS